MNKNALVGAFLLAGSSACGEFVVETDPVEMTAPKPTAEKVCLPIQDVDPVIAAMDRRFSEEIEILLGIAAQAPFVTSYDGKYSYQFTQTEYQYDAYNFPPPKPYAIAIYEDYDDGDKHFGGMYGNEITDSNLDVDDDDDLESANIYDTEGPIYKLYCPEEEDKDPESPDPGDNFWIGYPDEKGEMREYKDLSPGVCHQTYQCLKARMSDAHATATYFAAFR